MGEEAGGAGVGAEEDWCLGVFRRAAECVDIGSWKVSVACREVSRPWIVTSSLKPPFSVTFPDVLCLMPSDEDSSTTLRTTCWSHGSIEDKISGSREPISKNSRNLHTPSSVLTRPLLTQQDPARKPNNVFSVGVLMYSGNVGSLLIQGNTACWLAANTSSLLELGSSQST